MALLIIGLVVFFSVHVFSGFRGARAAVIQRLGMKAYKGAYALIALAGLVLIVMGKADAPFVSVYVPMYELAIVTKLLMLPALVFLAASNIPCNIRTKLKHPMLIAVKLWAVVHLLVNGDLASILLFGSFLIYAVATMVRLKRREPEAAAAPVPEYPLWRDIAALLAGGVLYAVIGLHHAHLFGVAIH